VNLKKLCDGFSFITENHTARMGSSTASRPVSQTPDVQELTTSKSNLQTPSDSELTLDTNNTLPTPTILSKIQSLLVLDRTGKSHPFSSLHTGPHVPRRVLIIFVRHFFCGNCQEYLRTLSAAITPESLLRLPISTSIAVVGCGDPGLIDMYASATGCPFEIYADPTRRLYDELGMSRTLALGSRPAYMKKGLFRSSVESVMQGLKQLGSGLVTKAGDQRQIGGEFLFEPLGVMTPGSPFSEREKGLGGDRMQAGEGIKGSAAQSVASLDGLPGQGEEFETKKVTWCHRMRNTRDHAEIPELIEVLGLDQIEEPPKRSEDAKGRQKEDRHTRERWERALEERKGTGLTMAGQMSTMRIGTDGDTASTAGVV
jgi:hypothetical protein